jgi:hypothetical protein
VFSSNSMGSSDMKDPSEVYGVSRHAVSAAEEPFKPRANFGLSARQNDHEQTARFVGCCVVHHQKLLR